MAEVPLWLNIRWGAFYVLVNVVQLAQIYYEQRSVEMDPAAKEIFEVYFQRHGLTPVQFQKLMLLSTTKAFAPGDMLTEEGKVASELILLIDGSVGVDVAGEHADVISDGHFIG